MLSLRANTVVAQLLIILVFATFPVGPAAGQAIGQGGTEGSNKAQGKVEQAAPKRSVIRFLTDSDYPPFNYRDEEGTLVGFNVDIARAICLELDVTCDIATRPWDELLTALGNGEGDAIIASLAISPEALREAEFTAPYYFTPARFVARRDLERLEMTPKGLEGRSVAVVRGSAHEAYIDTFFRDCILKAYETLEAAQKALMAGEVDFLFGDAMSLVFWLTGTLSKGCCEFRGGPFFEPRYFGEGVAIAVRKGDHALRADIDKALAKLRESGRYEELFLRYFPLKVY